MKKNINALDMMAQWTDNTIFFLLSTECKKQFTLIIAWHTIIQSNRKLLDFRTKILTSNEANCNVNTIRKLTNKTVAAQFFMILIKINSINSIEHAA